MSLYRCCGVPDPQPEPEPEKCPGFAWIGQPLSSCDNCGEPYWEHDYEEILDRSAPFGFGYPCQWKYVAITEQQKIAVRRKWG